MASQRAWTAGDMALLYQLANEGLIGTLRCRCVADKASKRIRVQLDF